MGQPEGSKLDAHKALITGWVEKDRGATLEELTARLAEEVGLQVHHTTVMRALSRWGYSYKKTLYAREQNRDDVQEERTLWRKLQQSWDRRKLVFIDECDQHQDDASLWTQPVF